MTHRSFLKGALAGAALATACKPNLSGRVSLVQEDTLIAAASAPAEAAPGDTVQYSSLYVGPQGPVDSSVLDWAFCTERKPLAVTGSIALACLAPRAKALDSIGQGGSVTGELPENMCKTFGPEPPDPVAGQPPAAPEDPDTTGGFYQPLRLLVPTPTGASYSVVTTRLDCGLANPTQAQSIAYSKVYKPNQNPKLDALVLTHESGSKETVPPDETTASLTVKPGESTSFEASWSDCLTGSECAPCSADGGVDAGTCPESCATPTGCTGSESYLYLDPIAHDLVSRREAIRVSWFATDGSFDHDRTGQTEAEAATPKTDNAWTAPDSAGSVHLWVVIRDDRGGVGWSSYLIDVAS